MSSTPAYNQLSHELPTSKAGKLTRPAALALISCFARCLPDFLIIGAQKAATTSLFAYLQEHPAIWLPPCKECHYFTRPWRPVAYYRAFFPTRGTRRQQERMLGHPLRIGEATPYYLHHPAAPARVASVLPDIQLIALLRDPVERAYSHYRHAVRHGFETLSFEDALAAEEQRAAGDAERMARAPYPMNAGHKHFSYVQRGRYAEQLRRWLRHFPREQIHIEVAEHLIDVPAETLARIEGFLKLPSAPDRKFGIHNKGNKTGEMNPDTKASLREIFAEPNRELEELLGIELPWPRA